MSEDKANIEAIHFEGGNYYDDMKIDIDKSQKKIDSAIFKKTKRSGAFLLNTILYFMNAVLQKTRLQEFMVSTGLRRKWFDDFHSYWLEVLGGRPITLLEFHQLLFNYRKKEQYIDELDWDTPEAHVNNWQKPSQLFTTFHNVRKTALTPVIGHHLWKRLKKKSKVLEYGCSIAPYYFSYRQFLTHLDCQWVLADIPNFPSHYAKYLYKHDECAEFLTILPDQFRSPLKEHKNFDVIILTTVLEHLDDPEFVSGYLLDRLNTGGLFVFDYVISEGTGLDTPESLKKRVACLELILERVNIEFGSVDVSKDVRLCIGKKLR